LILFTSAINPFKPIHPFRPFYDSILHIIYLHVFQLRVIDVLSLSRFLIRLFRYTSLSSLKFIIICCRLLLRKICRRESLLAIIRYCFRVRLYLCMLLG